MAAPFSDLQSKTEAALKAVVETVSLANRGNAAVYVGLDGNVDLPANRFECAADGGTEDPPHSGNFALTAAVFVCSDADAVTTSPATPLTVHRSRLAYVMDALFVDNLAALLSAAVADFTCIGVRSRTILPQRKDDRHMISEIQFELLCCPTDF